MKALKRLHPGLVAGFDSPVVYHTQKVPPGRGRRKDYHFRSCKEVKALKADDRYRVLEVRDQIQAFDVKQVRKMIEAGDDLFQGNVNIAPAMKKPGAGGGVRVDLFLSPLRLAELQTLAKHGAFEDQLIGMIRRQKLRRAHAKSAHLSLPDLADVEPRRHDLRRTAAGRPLHPRGAVR